MATIKNKICYNKRKYHPIKFVVAGEGILEELTFKFLYERRLGVTKVREKYCFR